MSDLPSFDEFMSDLPLASEAIPADLGKPSIFSSRGIGKAFREGWTRGFGEPFPATKEIGDILKNSGLLGDIENHRQSILEEFWETVLYGPVLAIDLGARAFMGGVTATSEAAVATGLPREATPGAALEVFPFGIRAPMGIPRVPTRPPIDLDVATELGVMGRRLDRQEAARKAFAVPDEAGLNRAVPETPPPLPETVATPDFVPDVHATARILDPDTFGRYDDLVTTREALRNYLGQFRAAEPDFNIGGVAVPRDTPLIEGARAFEELGEQRTVNLGGREVPANARLLDTAARLETDIAAEGRTANEVPLNAPLLETARAIERDLTRLDSQIVELAPRVSEVYREARTLEAIQDNALSANDTVQQVAQIVAETRSREVRNLAQRAPAIRADVERRLVSLGRPRAEARAHAAIVEAYYQTRAERFGGALGTAKELYDREAPGIRFRRGVGKGAFDRQARIITLTQRADASTFLHETAHDWLDTMVRDAKHPQAPPDLIANYNSVKEWLGVKGDSFTRAQLERFARGAERYYMEGQAPTARLATVFEQLRDWFTRIYQTVTALKVNLTPEIRQVYDRLLSVRNDDPVIAPERPGARTFAEEHTIAARETPIAEAAAKADEMRRQRDIVGSAVQRAIDDARRQARRGPERINLPDEGSGERRTQSGRARDNTDDGGIGEGRVGATGAVERGPDGSFTEGQSAYYDYKAGNIRLENLNVSDDVRAAIKEAAGVNGGFLHARRGRLSDVETRQLADEIGESSRLLDRWAIGQAFNAEEIIAARRLLQDSATNMLNLAGKAVDERGIVAYALGRERHMMIQEMVSGITAEAGRALRAFRQMESVTDPALLRTLFQQTVKMTPEKLMQEAQLVSKLRTTQQVNKAMTNARKPGYADMAVEAWINGLLSGPMTHIVNVASNAGVVFNSIAETAVAAAVSKVRGTNAVTFAEVSDRFWAALEGAVDGIKAAGDVIMDEGKIPFAGRSMDTHVRQAIPSKTINIGGLQMRVGGATIRLPGRFLAAEDEFFKAIAHRQEINVLARRAAREEGLTGRAFAQRIAELRNTPTDSMLAAAKEFSEYQTFTRELGRTGTAVTAFVNSHPALRFIMPFIRTPINLLKYSSERSVLGFASQEVRARLRSDIPQVRDTQIARMVLGNAIALGTGWLVINELISDGGPTDRGAQETLRNTGWQPYSVRIGDVWYSYRRFDPLSNIVGLAADFTKVGQYLYSEATGPEDDEQYDKIGSMIQLAIWRNLGDKLALRGVSGFFKAATDWERYGDSFVNGMLTSVVPAAVSQIGQMDDPVMREARSLLDAYKNRFPGLRETLFPRLNRWGEPITQTDIGPIATRAVNNDPVDQAMLELEINKAQPSRDINGIDLTPEQYFNYVQTSGVLAKSMLDGIVTPQFRQMPKAAQVSVINNIFKETREMARARVTAESVGSDNDLVQKGMANMLRDMN